MNRKDLDLKGLETYYIMKLIETRETIESLENLHTDLYAKLLEIQLLLHQAEDNKFN